MSPKRTVQQASPLTLPTCSDTLAAEANMGVPYGKDAQLLLLLWSLLRRPHVAAKGRVGL